VLVLVLVLVLLVLVLLELVLLELVLLLLLSNQVMPGSGNFVDRGEIDSRSMRAIGHLRHGSLVRSQRCWRGWMPK
jgi:hypothetical protein